MKILVCLLAGIGLVGFGVHMYNDAGTIPIAPTPMESNSRIVVTPQGWSAEPVAPASSFAKSANQTAIIPPQPPSRVAEVAGPVVMPPQPPLRGAETVGPDITPPPAKHYASESWGQPARVQVNVHESEFRSVGSFVGVIFLVGMLAILAIVIRSLMRGKSAPSSDETALVHELARRAQEMSQRMESLETILLDRTRTAR